MFIGEATEVAVDPVGEGDGDDVVMLLVVGGELFRRFAWWAIMAW